MVFGMETSIGEPDKREALFLFLNTVILATAIWGLFVFLPMMGIFLTRKEIIIYVSSTLALSLSIMYLGSTRKNDKRGAKRNTVVCRDVVREILGIPCDRSDATMEKRG